MEYEVKDRVRWKVHDDEPELTGTVYEADHKCDYYFIKVDLKDGQTIQMSSGMPGRNIIGPVEHVPKNDNVVSIDEFKLRNLR